QHGDKDMTVSPAIFLKLFQDWAAGDLDRRLKRAESKKKEKGSGGGIRIVLPNPVVDPLLRPGQPPRGLRLLGEDPSKPLPDTTRTSTMQPASSGPVHPQPLAPKPEVKFDPTELIDDDLPQPCHKCDGWGRQRIGFGDRTEPCDRCGGTRICN